ncbi:MAG: T9SS type A sorting domain-containing protein [Ignavibacterium sp.]|nr:T9SS type A sorting domain-containing protein [Ignavibacterium sp.]
MKNITLNFLFIISFTFNSNAQVSQEWLYEINSPGIIYGQGNAVVCDQNNNIYVGGTVSKSSTTWPTFIKMNSDGTAIFIDTLSLGNGGFSLTSLFYDNQSTVYATGQLSDSISTMFIAAYDTSGFRIWLHTYLTDDNEEILGVQISKSPNGNLYALGNTYDSLFKSHLYLIQSDLSGNPTWNSNDSGLNVISTFPKKFVIDQNEQIYCLANAQLNGSNNIDIILICYDQNGSVLWYHSINGPLDDDDFDHDINIDNSGNILISGYIQDTVPTNNCLIEKYDPMGNLLWSKIYNMLGSGKILIDQENNIYIDGTDSVFTNLFGISKLDSSGNLLYTRNFNLLNYWEILISDMKMDDSSNIYLTGNGFSLNSVYDFITYKLDTSLNEIWHVQYLDTNTLGESPTSLALDHNGSVYVTGMSNYDQVSTTSNLCLVKYNQGFTTDINNNPDDNVIIIYPNPAINSFTIKLNFEFKNASINIYDIVGQKIFSKNLHNQNEITLNAQNILSKGIYLVKIIDGKKEYNSKLIIE